MNNAKGQREAIWYGNGTKTSYSYDALSQRLNRLLTVRLSDNQKLQDLNYFYDPVGNITIVRNDAQEDVFFSGNVVSPDNDYCYDALYRLVEAHGREQKASAVFGSGDNSGDGHAFVSSTTPWDGSSNSLQQYSQKYSYDAVGNILSLQHIASAGSYTRTYGYDATSNRLLSTQIGNSTPYVYSHDTRGNMTAMPHLSDMDYDALNQMSHVTAGSVNGYYQYSGGQRVRKFLDKGSSVTEERIYFGNYEVFRKWMGTTLNVERTTLHVNDDSGRIAMLEKRTAGSDSSEAELARYIYSNHLQSSALELDDAGSIVSYEEYHPYGTTAYHATNSAINAVAKRYRYTGKERDEETGLNYHGARYYAPWLGRWGAVDPKENERAGISPFDYCSNDPVNRHDRDGMKDTQAQEVLFTAKRPSLAWKSVNPNGTPEAPSNENVPIENSEMITTSTPPTEDQSINLNLNSINTRVTIPKKTHVATNKINSSTPSNGQQPLTKHELIKLQLQTIAATTPFGSLFFFLPIRQRQNLKVGNNSKLTDADYNRLAQSIDARIEPAALRAVTEVESSSGGFEGGRPKLRFEGHKFLAYYQDHGLQIPEGRTDLFYPYSKANTQNKAHGDTKFQEAIRMNRQAAIYATAFGFGQVQGFNFEMAGFKNLEEFYQAQFSFEGQVRTFVGFIKSNPILIKALINKDFATFPHNYNGKSYKDNNYDVRMFKAYQKYR